MRAHVRTGICVAIALATPGHVLGAPQAQEASAPLEGPPAPPGYPAQGPARFDRDAAAELEVERAPTGHLLVQPRVDGRDAGWFIFDTGAGICVVSTPHVEALGLVPGGSLTATGVGTQQVDLLRAGTLVLGPLSLEDVPMIAVDLSFLREHLGREIAGVIGYGVLSRCVAEIDLSGPRVALHDPRAFALEEGEWTPATFERLIPVVTARYEGREGRFTLDTGANGAISFHRHAVDRHGLVEGREVSDGRLGGVGGTIPTKKGLLEWIELGGERREDVEADFELEAKGAVDEGVAGNIGAGLLRAFVLVTDYGGSRVAFRPVDGG